MKYYTIKELQTNEIIKELVGKGVYIMKNSVNKNSYIGSTTRSFRQRWKEIRKACRKEKGISKRIVKEWKKYKEENFVFGILEITDEAEIAEAKWIEQLNPYLNNIKYPTQYLKSKKSNKAKLYIKKLEDKGQEILKTLNKTKVEKVRTCAKKLWVIKTNENTIIVSSLNKFARDYLNIKRHPKEILTAKFIKDAGVTLTQEENTNCIKYDKRNRKIYKQEKLDKIKTAINNINLQNQNIKNPKWIIKIDNKNIYLKSINKFIEENSIPFITGYKNLDSYYKENGLEIIKIYDSIKIFKK